MRYCYTRVLFLLNARCSSLVNFNSLYYYLVKYFICIYIYISFVKLCNLKKKITKFFFHSTELKKIWYFFSFLIFLLYFYYFPFINVYFYLLNFLFCFSIFYTCYCYFICILFFDHLILFFFLMWLRLAEKECVQNIGKHILSYFWKTIFEIISRFS